MSSKNQVTLASYNQAAKLYAETTMPKPAGIYKDFLDTFVAYMNDNSKILEIGSGHGRDANYLRGKGLSVQTTDAALSFVDLLNQNGDNAIVLNPLLADVPEGFDAIMAMAVLVHFSDKECELVMQKIYKSLEIGGLFVFTVLEGQGDVVTDSRLGVERYFNYWKQSSLEELVTKSGLTVVRIEKAQQMAGDRYWLYVITRKDA